MRRNVAKLKIPSAVQSMCSMQLVPKGISSKHISIPDVINDKDEETLDSQKVWTSRIDGLSIAREYCLELSENKDQNEKETSSEECIGQQNVCVC